MWTSSARAINELVIRHTSPASGQRPLGKWRITRSVARTHLYSSKKLPIRSPKYSTHTRYMIGVSLNKPHTIVTSLHTCMCMFALILLGPTTYRKSLLTLILCILHHALIKKEFEDKSRRREPWTVYLLDGDNKDRDYSWTYLFSV